MCGVEPVKGVFIFFSLFIFIRGAFLLSPGMVMMIRRVAAMVMVMVVAMVMVVVVVMLVVEMEVAHV